MTNLILILCDDVGPEQFSAWGLADDGAQGGQKYPATPNITKLANGGSFNGVAGNGFKFTRFYVEQLCSPTRATLLTGRHPFRHGVGDIARTDNGTPNPLSYFLPDGEETLFEQISRQVPTTKTAVFGKWHLGTTVTGGGRSPERAGFMEHAIHEFNLTNQTGGWSYEVNTTGGNKYTTKQYYTVFSVDKAIDFIKNAQGSPFALYLPLTACHSPFTNNSKFSTRAAPPDDGHYDGVVNWTQAQEYWTPWTTTDPEGPDYPPDPNVIDGRPPRHSFKACVEYMDYQIGRLLDSIPAATLQDTIVVFLTDNGTGFSLLQPDSIALPSPTYTVVNPQPGEKLLRTSPATWDYYPTYNAKDSPFEGGVRVPCAVWGVAGVGVSTGSYTKIAHAVDLMPTLLEMLGLEQNVSPVDGLSLADVISGSTSVAKHSYVYSEWFQHGNDVNNPKYPPITDDKRSDTAWAVIGQQYKLVYLDTTLRAQVGYTWGFFDLSVDPLEWNNLYPTMNAAQTAERDAMLAFRTALLAS